MLKLVFCSGLWVIVFAESSSDAKTSSIDDSQDSASKHNAKWLKSRTASRDMSYSSSFGSEDFDSPDIPSDFHARWGANKSWYVKTPHPFLSRRESFEEYGRAPVVLESEEEDSSEHTEPTVTGDSTVTLADAVDTPVTVSNASAPRKLRWEGASDMTEPRDQQLEDTPDMAETGERRREGMPDTSKARERQQEGAPDVVGPGKRQREETFDMAVSGKRQREDAPNMAELGERQWESAPDIPEPEKRRREHTSDMAVTGQWRREDSPEMADPEYRQRESAPDMSELDYRAKAAEFLQTQVKTSEQRRRIEVKTRAQRDSALWLALRRTLLTASSFGAVCRRQPHTPCDRLVNRLLYGEPLNLTCVEYGRDNEHLAIAQLGKMGVQVAPCGMFVDAHDPFLAATPDGLIGDDGLLEVKCPYSAGHMTPEEAIVGRRGAASTFWKVNGGRISEVNTNHTYYYQIQGQLHVTGRDYCVFVVWTPRGMRLERIDRDDDFWRDRMYGKLRAFYMDCLLPEIVDPRRARSLPIRNPRYIEDAISTRYAAAASPSAQKSGLASDRVKSNILYT